MHTKLPGYRLEFYKTVINQTRLEDAGKTELPVVVDYILTGNMYHTDILYDITILLHLATTVTSLYHLRNLKALNKFPLTRDYSRMEENFVYTSFNSLNVSYTRLVSKSTPETVCIHTYIRT